jgi:hypothetical protein
VRAKRFPQDANYSLVVPKGAGSLHIEARLRYRKIDQYLLNFVFGEHQGLTAPITDMTAVTRVIEIVSKPKGLGDGQ